MSSSLSEDLKPIKDLLLTWGVVSNDSDLKLSILGGGISNLIVKVQSSEGTWVLKQPLEKLKANEDWYADRSRVLREVACLEVIRKYVGEEYAPRVLFEDKANYACLLEYAPDGTTNWKQELLHGNVNPNVTEKVARFLSQFDLNTRGVKSIKEEFRDITNFLQLRIDPYLLFLADQHSDLKGQLKEIVTGLTSIQITLVHGDFSPKNILLLPDGRLWIIDAEVAHYGNHAFDIAFCLTHLILKSLHLKSPSHLREAKSFWRHYWKESEELGQQNFTVRVLAGLMLARIDGKSPVEYLAEDVRSRVRKLSRQLIEQRVDDFDQLVGIVEEEL